MGFEGVPQNLSREGLVDRYGDEGYSKRHEKNEVAAFEDYSISDEVKDIRIKSAISTVVGTEASESI